MDSESIHKDSPDFEKTVFHTVVEGSLIQFHINVYNISC